jgi:hypothetical protein
MKKEDESIIFENENFEFDRNDVKVRLFIKERIKLINRQCEQIKSRTHQCNKKFGSFELGGYYIPNKLLDSKKKETLFEFEFEEESYIFDREGAELRQEIQNRIDRINKAYEQLSAKTHRVSIDWVNSEYGKEPIKIKKI